MKTAFMALGLCAIMYVVIASTYGSEYEVIKETATTTVESVEEEYPDEWLQEAEEAKNAVLRRKELEHELDIKNQQKDALEAEIEALERDLGTY